MLYQLAVRRLCARRPASDCVQSRCAGHVEPRRNAPQRFLGHADEAKGIAQVIPTVNDINIQVFKSISHFLIVSPPPLVLCLRAASLYYLNSHL